MTDVEFLELRYPGRSGRILRGFKAVYLGGGLNALVIGTQLIAIGEIGEHVLGMDRTLTMSLGAGIALMYSILAGFTGVVITDFLQFILAIVGSVLLAVFVLDAPAVGGLSGLASQLAGGVTRDGQTIPVLQMWPGVDTPFFDLSMLAIAAGVSWWSVVYGGMEPGGGGQIVQRILAARNERHAVGASLWFNVAHFALRMWPWILVGLAAIVLYPETSDFQSVYARAISDVLPSGVRGLLVASFFAAFISTMDTRLNLGCAYLVNDFYKRFLVRDRDPGYYVKVSRIVTVLLSVVPFAIPLLLGGQIINVVMFWMQITAGTGLVYILRWYWWRINAWSEISAMIAAVVYTLLLLWLKYDWDLRAYEALDASFTNILIITVLTTVTWVAVTFLTRPENTDALERFYAKAGPGGPGWRPIRLRRGQPAVDTSGSNLSDSTTGWIASSAFLLFVFFGTGNLLLGEFDTGGILLALAIVSLAISVRATLRIFR